jgi:hypothetical protein
MTGQEVKDGAVCQDGHFLAGTDKRKNYKTQYTP